MLLWHARPCELFQAIPSYTVELLKLISLYRILLWGCVITFVIACAIVFVLVVFH